MGLLRRAGLPAVALAVVAVLLAVALVLLLDALSGRHAADDARAAARKAATEDVQALLSYDYRHLDADFGKAAAAVTGDLAKQYKETNRAIAPAAKQYHAVVAAVVKEVAVTDATADTASALVFVDQVSTNTQLSAPRAEQQRLQVDLVRRHGRWLLADLSTV